MQSLLNPIALTQHGMPSLLELLKEEYRRLSHLQNQEKLQAMGTGKQPPMDLVNYEADLAAAGPFFAFCDSYLGEHRPVELFPLDLNYGLRLSNGLRCCVCPGTDPGGTMQESGAVSVTQGRSQPGMEGAVHVNDALRV